MLLTHGAGAERARLQRPLLPTLLRPARFVTLPLLDCRDDSRLAVAGLAPALS
jgi:hypothetical protein